MILLSGSLNGYREGVGQGQPVRLSNATPQSYEMKTMTTYIAALQPDRRWHQGREGTRFRAGSTPPKKLLAAMGGEMKQFYMVMGEF